MSTIDSIQPAPPATIARAHHQIPLQQLVLAALILLEIAIFSMIGRNFLTLDNFLNVGRLNVELGLVALALTRQGCQ